MGEKRCNIEMSINGTQLKLNILARVVISVSWSEKKIKATKWQDLLLFLHR